LIKVFTRDGACDSGLSCTGQTIKPEKDAVILSIGPGIYLLKKANSGIRETYGFMLLVIGVKRRISSYGQVVE
jgi:hypothetical protein